MRIQPSKKTWFGAALLALMLPWACSDSASTGSVSDPPSGPGNGNGNGDGSPVPTSSVGVRDSFFNPQAIVVEPGTTVTWNWQGSFQHNVTWSTGDFTNSPTQASGTHEVTMPSSPGDFAYYCTIHGSPGSGMHGTIRVE